MKSLISKTALLLLCSSFALSSCSKDDSGDKKTVTVKYRILVNAAQKYARGSSGGGIEKLYLYTNQEMAVVSEAYDKKAWTITETAETEMAAIAACDKKAIAVFDQKLSAMNTATASIKTKFDTKKADLLSEITTESSEAHVIYTNYGGVLYKENEENTHFDVVVKEGMLVSFQAIGGEK